MKKNELETIKKVKNNANEIMCIALLSLSYAPVYAGNLGSNNGIDISDLLKTFVNLILAIIAVMGIFSLVKGIIAVASAMTDSNGTDDTKLSKGKNQIIAGACELAAGSILALLGVTETIFNGLNV